MEYYQALWLIESFPLLPYISSLFNFFFTDLEGYIQNQASYLSSILILMKLYFSDAQDIYIFCKGSFFLCVQIYYFARSFALSGEVAIYIPTASLPLAISTLFPFSVS